MKRDRDLIPILVPAVFAALCSLGMLVMLAPTFEPPPVTPTVTPPPTSTPTSTPTIAPSPTLTPTATEILPTPDFLTLPIAEDFLFAPSSDPDCQLPCWQGLRIGESDRDDVQKLFDEGFGFSDAVDFFAPSPPIRIPSIYNLDLPGMQATGYRWQFPSEGDTEGGSFAIYILVDDETGILQGMRFHYLPIDDFPVHEPRQIIQNLGVPSYMYIETGVVPEEGSRSDTIAFNTHILYSAGMTFDFYFQADTQERIVNGVDRKYTSYCLDSRIAAGKDYIVAPFDDLWETELSPVQEAWLLGLADPVRYEPVEDVFDITLEEIADIAHNENPCIELDVTHLYE